MTKCRKNKLKKGFWIFFLIYFEDFANDGKEREGRDEKVAMMYKLYADCLKLRF